MRVEPEPSAEVPFREILRPRVRLWLHDRFSASSTHPGAVDGAGTHLLHQLSIVLTPALFRWFCAEQAASAPSWERAVHRCLEPDDSRRYEAFLKRLATQDLAELAAWSPVAVRLAGEALLSTIDHLDCMIQRFEEDRATIAKMLGEPPSKITAIGPGLSDRHDGGATVCVIELAERSVIYKPRSVALEGVWNEVMAMASSREGIPAQLALWVIERDGYGWMERARPAPCTRLAQVTQFYERLGGQLALLYFLAGTDAHLGNVLACAEYPVLVDCEALCQPERQEGNDPRTRLYRRTVLSTGLLPSWTWTGDGVADLSGIGAGGLEGLTRETIEWTGPGTDRVAATRRKLRAVPESNSPVFDGRRADPTKHAADVERGFVATWGWAVGRRAALLDLVARRRDAEGRLVLRDTETYNRLWRSLENTRYGADREIALRALSVDLPRTVLAGGAGQAVLEAEVEALFGWDVPTFRYPVAGTTLKSGAYDRIPGVLRRSGLEEVQSRFDGAGPATLDLQLRCIRASFAARVLDGLHGGETTLRGEVPAHEEDTDQDYLRRALAVGEFLRRTRLALSPDAATWVGLEFSRRTSRFEFRPLGDDLYSGRAGIALFLAALYACAPAGAWRDLAEDALHDLRPTTPGAVYALAACAVLLDEASHLEAVERALPALGRGDGPDLLSGAAGCVLAALYADGLGVPGALQSAVTAGDALVREATWEGSACSWSLAGGQPGLTGLSHGAAGIALALHRLGLRLGTDAYHEVVLGALRYERMHAVGGNWRDLRPGASAPLVAWCNGAAGIALARSFMLDVDNECSAELDAAVDHMVAFGLGQLDHLCCGAFGRAYILAELGRRFSRPHLIALARRTTRSVFDRAGGTDGLRLVRPEIAHATAAPGFMHGLCGIAYAGLRIANPRLPAVLSLSH